MKIIHVVAVLLALGSLNLRADQASAPAAQVPPLDQTGVPAPTAFHVLERGANHKVWQRETYEKRPDGTIITHPHQYTEVATGLSFKKDGQWTDAKAEIDAQPDGTAAATQGQQQVYFPADIYAGTIQMTTPDGQQLQSQPAALAYDDGVNTVIIAVLTNSVGQLVGTNQAIYANAFSGIKADVLYTYKLSGAEQDIVLREQPPTPESLGLNPNAKLQVLTEFFNPPTPVEQASVEDATGLADTTLKFGRTTFGHGRAFSMGNESRRHRVKSDAEVPVSKTWLKLQDRTFLIETVPYNRLTSQIKTLPVSSRAATPKTDGLYALREVSGHYAVPPARLAKANPGKVQFARLDTFDQTGLVLDYVTINTAETNFTFQGDTTYYISGEYNLFGLTTIEGGTVIKCASGGELDIDLNGTVNCETGPYHPAIFTSHNDDSVGEPLGSGLSSGTPAFGNVDVFLNFNPTNVVLHDLRFSYCYVGISQNWGATVANLDVWNCQFYNLDAAVFGYNAGLHNVLVSRSVSEDAAIFTEGPIFTAEQVTADGGNSFIELDYGATAAAALTNCLITRQDLLYPVGYPVVLTTNSTVYIPTLTTPIYQTVGAGAYYLTNGSSYRGAGTTGISPELAAYLATKTTWPPVVYSNVTLSVPTTLSPQAPRDTNAAPDIGYHYDPLDYIFGQVSVTTNLTFTAGTAVSWFDPSGYGMALSDGINVRFNGNASAPCVFAHYATVQEGNFSAWMGYNWFWFGMAATGSDSDPSLSALVSPQFTHFYSLANTHEFLRDYTAVVRMWAANSEFYDASEGGYGIGLCMTNCLFDRMYTAAFAGCCAQIALQNCTLHGGSLQDSHGSWPVTITNCAFDGTTFSMDAIDTACDYNAFVTNAARLPILGAHDVIVTNFNWQSSWLGDFYLPANSRLIDHGNPTADQLGLYHFTTQVSQVPEAGSTVDIGYHYVATDAFGDPLDSNGDGIPDYLEDANGNGLFDNGELLDWRATVGSEVMTFTNGFSISIFEPKPKSQIP